MSNQFCLVGMISSIGLFLAAPAIAQIAADRSAGSSVRRNGSNIQIEGGTQRGQNLFHSFRQFNVQSGERVTLTDPGVSNILLRVTGSRSTIDGTLAVGGDANLFLLNPRGIVFGRNAALDVRGSFVATTADAIRFGNQGSFSAIEETPGLLTVSPSAFLFNPTPHGAIVNQASLPQLNTSTGELVGLRVPDGNSLLLLGGEVQLEGGGLIALDGRVEVGGVVGEGTVNLSSGDRLVFAPTAQRADIRLAGRSQIAVANGNLVLQANTLQIDSSTLSADATEQTTINEQTTTNTSQIVLQADREISLSNGTSLTTDTFGGRNAGQIQVIAPQINISNNSPITATTYSGGTAGDVIIRAADRLELVNDSTISSSAAQGALGNAGSIDLQTNRLAITDSSVLTQARGSGISGDINIRAQRLLLSRGRVSATSSATDGGNIRITGAETLSLDRQSQISASAGTERTGGNGGNVSINAQFIVADPFSNSDITANAFQGNGGSVDIRSEQIFGIENRQTNTPLSDITVTSEFGNAGTVLINGLEADPSRSLAAALPTVPADATTQIAQTCGTAISSENQFIVTGRGGLPPTPAAIIGSEGTIVGWASLPEASGAARSPDRSLPTEPAAPPDLTEAQGWIVDSQGRVALVAHVPANGSVSDLAASDLASGGQCRQ